MVRVAIFNDYQLPVPAVKGGSVPTLTNLILDENEKEQKISVDVFSCYDLEAEKASASYRYCRFVFSKDAKVVRYFTNLGFVIRNKFHLPLNLSAIPMPRSAKRVFLKENYDVVYINGYIRGALPIIREAKKKNAAVIVHHHVVTDIIHDTSICGEKILDESNKMLFVSQFAANFAKTGSLKQNEKISCLRNAIDCSKFAAIEKKTARLSIRSKYGIRESDKVVLFVGRMVEYKGVLELIRGFQRALLGDSVKLLIVGGATYSSKKVTPYIKACLDEARSNENIIFAGYIPYDEIPNYYAAADIATLISRCDEAAGMVGLEAMASGLPIITTGRGGILEYIPRECCVVTPDNEGLTDSITSAIQCLITNEQLSQKMAHAGICKAQEFDKKQYYLNFVKLLDEVLD